WKAAQSGALDMSAGCAIWPSGSATHLLHLPSLRPLKRGATILLSWSGGTSNGRCRGMVNPGVEIAADFVYNVPLARRTSAPSDQERKTNWPAIRNMRPSKEECSLWVSDLW